MKIVLALAPVWDSVTPPLVLAFLKSSIEHAGHDCRCIDFSIQLRPMMVSALGDWEAESYVANHPKIYKGWAKQIADEQPDVVGFSILGSNLKNTALIAKELRNLVPAALIVSGGPSLTRENIGCVQDTFAFSDYVIEGEGESILVDFVRCYEQKGDFSRLKQLWKQDEKGNLSYTGAAALQNIDAISLPDFTDFNRSLYPCPHKLPMLFSRGCILNCNYCENKWNHLTQRSREGHLVFEELKHHVKKYGIKEYMFNDDSLISSKTLRQLDEYSDLVIAEGLVMPWSVYGTRVERLITQPFINKLRRSGMERVSLGVESFSSRVQHEMGKSSRYDDADKMCRMFANEGIRTESWIIYGYPTETDADFDETLQWFIKNPNVLSHVTANPFGPNAKYLQDRPGIVTSNSGYHWRWSGKESTLEKRKKRFFLLIDVLESIRLARKGDFTFYFGDPLYVKYFSSWTRMDKQHLLRNWERLENPEKVKGNGFDKVFNFFSLVNQGLRRKSVSGEIVPMPGKKTLEIGDTHEMRRKLFRRISSYLAVSGKLSEQEQINKLEYYSKYFQDIVVHLNDNVSENVFLALLLIGPVEPMLRDFDTHTPEYLAQMVVEYATGFNLPVLNQ